MVSCRCPQPSTRLACWPAASATSHTALPRWTPPASIQSASSREQAPATSLGFASASATRSCGDCDPGIAETAQEAVNALARAGAVMREFTLQEAEAAYAIFLQGSLSAIELRSFIDRELPDWLAQLGPDIAPAVRDAESLSARDYLARIARLRALARG